MITDQSDFEREANFARTVCDLDGKILYMNQKATEVFAKFGGKELIGKSLMDCHTEKSRAAIKEMLQTGNSNTYTITKNGVKKLIYQTPWYCNQKIAGLIELSFELPDKMNHFER